MTKELTTGMRVQACESFVTQRDIAQRAAWNCQLYT